MGRLKQVEVVLKNDLCRGCIAALGQRLNLERYNAILAKSGFRLLPFGGDQRCDTRRIFLVQIYYERSAQFFVA